MGHLKSPNKLRDFIDLRRNHPRDTNNICIVVCGHTHASLYKKGELIRRSKLLGMRLAQVLPQSHGTAGGLTNVKTISALLLMASTIATAVSAMPLTAMIVSITLTCASGPAVAL